AIAVSADGKRLVSSGIDSVKGRSVLLWDLETGKQIRVVGEKFSQIDARRLALTRDGKTLAAAELGRIKLFDAESGAEQRGLANGTTDQIQSLASSPDGLTLASVNEKGRIILWDVAKRAARVPGQDMTQPLTSVAVSPDGKALATTSYGVAAQLW